MRDPKTSGCGSAQALLRLPEDEAGSSPEQVELDSSSLLPQSLSPSQSQRLGMQRLFLHLKRSEGQVCWSGGGGKTHSGPAFHSKPSLLYVQRGEKRRQKSAGASNSGSGSTFSSYTRAGRGGSRLPQPPPPHLGEPQPKSHGTAGVTHGRARVPHRCYPGSRCRHHISSVPGCSDCSCRRTPQAGTEVGGCRTGWLPRGKHRQDFNQATESSFPRGKRVPTRVSGQPTLAGDRVLAQDLVLGTGTLTAPGGGQAKAAAAPVVDTAFVGAH